ncbi:hypothetical protein MRX96_040263 [Rhipicephalus microplus]
MVRLRSASVRSEIFGYASFADGVKTISTLHRYLGYSFLSWNDVYGESQLSVRLVSPYLAYAVASWCFYAFVMIQDGYHVITSTHDEGSEALRTIDKCILMFYFVRCVGIQLVHVATLVCYSHELCDVVKTMEDVESTLQRPTRLRPVAKLIILQNVLFSVAALYSIIDEITEFEGHMGPLYMKVLYSLFSLVFAETACMVSFSWTIYLSQAFASFLRCVNEDITNLVSARSVPLSELESQHARFCELWRTFVRCDRIFSWCLLFSVPLDIMNASPWGYYILTSDKSALNLSMDVIGFATMFAELFVLCAYGGAAQLQVSASGH